jgi:signal transduction histidine kinase
LTAGIAHEVKNPLNARMIHLELLRTKLRAGAIGGVASVAGEGRRVERGLGLAVAARAEAELSPLTKGALEHVHVIESEIRRLDEVVQGFLKFSRPEDLRLQPVSLPDLFEEILHIVQPEAERNKVTVEVARPDWLPAVNGDAAMLRQALLNLAINACQAMTQGGTLRLAANAASQDRVEVRVTDTGVGIAPEHLSRIFDLYFTTKHDGTGIGLSMVYRIIQLHDGDVEVESTPGRGTTFRVLLPRAHEV